MESDAGKDGSRKRMYKKCYDVEKLKKYVNEGKSNVEIAYLLDISVATVIAGVSIWIKRDAETWQTEKGE